MKLNISRTRAAAVMLAGVSAFCALRPAPGASAAGPSGRQEAIKRVRAGAARFARSVHTVEMRFETLRTASLGTSPYARLESVYYRRGNRWRLSTVEYRNVNGKFERYLETHQVNDGGTLWLLNSAGVREARARDASVPAAAFADPGTTGRIIRNWEYAGGETLNGCDVAVFRSSGPAPAELTLDDPSLRPGAVEPDGGVFINTVWIDPCIPAVVRSLCWPAGGSGTAVERVSSDFRKTGGWSFPFRTVVRAEREQLVVEVSGIGINGTLPEDVFDVRSIRLGPALYAGEYLSGLELRLESAGSEQEKASLIREMNAYKQFYREYGGR